eukprot:3788278-Prymnesium_polylepis.1
MAPLIWQVDRVAARPLQRREPRAADWHQPLWPRCAQPTTAHTARHPPPLATCAARHRHRAPPTTATARHPPPPPRAVAVVGGA